MNEELTPFQEVEKRKQDLIAEWGDDNYDIIEINEILRDEFNDEKYEQALIDLGVNDEDTGLEDLEDGEENLSEGSENKDRIMQILLTNKKHIFETKLRLLNIERHKDGRLIQKGKELMPREDVDLFIQLLEALYSPQSLSTKLMKDVAEFDDNMNEIITNLNSRLGEYTDDIVSGNENKKAIDIILNEIEIVRLAIKHGRLGDITRDISINSYNEKNDLTTDDKIENVRQQLRV